MNRINNLLQLLNEKELDGILITSEPNITYLSGFTGDSSRLIVSKNGTAFLTDGRYTEQAVNECHPEIEIVKWINDERYSCKTYVEFVNKFHINKLGFEGDIVSYLDFKKLSGGLKGIELIPVKGMVENLRFVKDFDEIEMLRHASLISDKALERTIPFIKKGVSEADLTAKLEYNLKMLGAEAISFDTIILSGTKTSLLHGKPDSKLLEDGDFVLFDFGAVYKGYHADMSRTFVVGKTSRKHIELFEIIQKAEQAAIDCLKPGLDGKVPDQIVRDIIPDKYIQYYYPGLGHGVGLEIHEDPFIRDIADFKYQKGMVITIEPGIYIPGWGGLRIEDTVVITDDSVEILNQFPKDFMKF